MSRYLIISALIAAQFSFAQEKFQSGNFYGLKYDGKEYYAAVFDEIEVKGFFAYGRQGDKYFNLSRNKENSRQAYNKFKFNLFERLLVVGVTDSGKIDLLDDTGQHLYLKDGEYSNFDYKEKRITYGNDDILISKKEGKQGLYMWTEQREIIPPTYERIAIHEACDSDDYFIYAKDKANNIILNQKSDTVLIFKSAMVGDMRPSPICQGYIIETHGYVGYCYKKRSGKYFLMKPRYDEIIFPWGDPSLIITKRNEKFGLYFNFERVLKAKFNEIEILDHQYLLARVKKDEYSYLLNKTGDLSAVTD